MKNIISTTVKIGACIAIIASMSSCRTIRGAGQDMQHLGNKIENKANQHSHY